MATKQNKDRSAQAFTRACRNIPGGVNSPVRAFGGVDVKPVFIYQGHGSKVVDLDGNSYIDYVGSWGPLILGHAHPKVVEAVCAAAQRGTSFGAPTLAETELAERYPVPDELPQRLGEGHPVRIIIIEFRLVQFPQQVGMATLPKRRLHRVVRGPEVGDQDSIEDLGKELL